MDNKPHDEVENDEGEEQKTAEGEASKPKPMPIQVIYCPICTLPPEYCSYGPGPLDKCATWLKDNHPAMFEEFYPNGVPAPKNAPKEAAPPKDENKAAATPEEEKSGEKKVQFAEPDAAPKKEKKAKVVDQIVITTSKRNNKKFLTTVAGLDKIGINVKDAQKKFGKKFACGASVLADNSIEIQGDIAYELEEYILKEFPTIKGEQIVIKEKKQCDEKEFKCMELYIWIFGSMSPGVEASSRATGRILCVNLREIILFFHCTSYYV
eukprot:TRINITY_DN2654_c0_g1_i1.p1 TRINITY_DN2654_c0_g1~~TRINITY_DN2654_c0_g1_i1.p1  ORF type:complete len:266 (-),score=70.56 TRINITY_DN2654_c0_g1_i1:161-958(-)